jgi:hypothetical protein
MAGKPTQYSKGGDSESPELQTKSKGFKSVSAVPSKRKDCMVQVCLRKMSLFGGQGDVDIVEDTGLITRKQAEVLWHKWQPKVYEQLKEGLDVEMGIWINCKDTTDYHTFIAHIDRTCEADDRGNVWQVKRELVKP